ncbi:aspartate--tRNA(Asn) ligase [Gryllotalpicola ginsengisoli]|uniref:aspartate--tRNA(Asn) ligase n=1 Tax=Gryllotalpicola ginsengisoli TaxID=444608 RepID=UPI0003B6DC97|nr:aspartate--tRNA(Asn) ligase [Gryllotalpicola ginsengisoli]
MTHRTLIKDLAALPDGPVTVAGWVETVRDQKKVQFVVLRDESGAVQLVNPAVREIGDDVEDRDAASVALGITESISALSLGSFVSVTGTLKHDERVKLGGLEVKIASLDVAGTSAPESPIAADSSLDKRLDYRWIDLRQPKNALIFKVQTTLEHAWRTWWVENGFVEIHTPKLMESPSESRAELFQLDYFDLGTAYLAQSPQHFKQMAQAAGFGKVFEISPVFRADPSFTSRHATEFISVDAEMSWIDSYADVMDMQEQLLAAGLAAVAEKHGEEIRELFGVEVQLPTTPFPRIPLAEVHRILREERGYVVPREDGDLDPEGERQISAYVKEKYGHDFVFVTDYPANIRPYYHMRDPETGLTCSYDLLYNGTEITTGAQREHRIDQLLANAEDKGLDPAGIGEYLEFFKYGMPPHGGFGMGLARVLMLLLGESSIRETTLLFRGPTRLAP